MNDSRRRDPRQEVARELAGLLATDEGARTARLLQLVEAFGPPAEAGGERTARGEQADGEADGPAPISIWRPQQRHGELVFVRPPTLPLGDHYAARRTIPARRAAGSCRVAFFGESAAAGYLYAPLLTPAGVLEEALNAGGRCYEVVDLARTNETLASLVATARASLQLDPDLLVIFAGNNWNLLETPEVSPYFPSVRVRQRYGLALRRGLGGPRSLAARRLRDKASEALEAIAGIAGGRPVVIVVPEVNLSDWEDRQPVPWLSGRSTAAGPPDERIRRWYELYDRARRHLAGERWTEAAAAARSLIGLDGGRCPTGHLLLGRALAGSGDPAAAREAFEAQVEHGAYATLAFLGAPRATPSVQRLLRRAARRHGFATVDLPAVFARHTGSALPGRRLFLDYCHLTREGIEVAMAAVAREVLRLPTGRRRTSRTSRTGRTGRTGRIAEAEAVALVGAAVHTAHRMTGVGAKGPVIEDLLRRALAASPGIAGTLLDLAAARSAPCPEVLTAAQERNLASPYRLLLQQGWRWDGLDPELLRAISEVLGEAAREEIHRLLLAHHGVGTEPRELARPPYLWEPVERFYPEAMDLAARAFYRSPWRSSSFCLIADAGRDLELAATLRLPAIPGADERDGEVSVRVGGEAVATLRVGEAWTRSAVRIPRRVLGPAIHRLTLRWPTPPDAGDAALSQAVRRLEQGLEADVHPVFGEVFSLLARSLEGAAVR